MNYATIRDKIYGDLLAVSGIGKVFKQPRFSADWATFLSMFTTTNPHDASKKVVNVAWITRRAFTEADAGKGSRDEAEAITAVQRDETWEVTVIYGFDDDETNPSEADFQPLVDAVAAKFRMMDQAGLPATVEESWPMQLEAAGLFLFGEVLCHKAVLTIRIQQRITS